jgi:hypothetical protein
LAAIAAFIASLYNRPVDLSNCGLSYCARECAILEPAYAD